MARKKDLQPSTAPPDFIPFQLAKLVKTPPAGERWLHKMPSQYVLDHVRFSTQPITIPKNRTHFGWLLDNFVASSGQNYQTIEDAGRTIYMYSGNATWVNGNVWYRITGNSSLSSGQLTNIATSM